jgi:hypothetical protein
MSINQLADQYFSSVRKRDLDSLCALYAPDAVLAMPDGTELNGVAAIRAMYSGLFANNAPSPTALNVTVGDNLVATELQIRLPNGESRYTADFFHLNSAGLIARLNVYARK